MRTTDSRREARREWRAVEDYDRRVESVLAPSPSHWMIVGISAATAAMLVIGMILAVASGRQRSDRQPSDWDERAQARPEVASKRLYVELSFPRTTSPDASRKALAVLRRRAMTLGRGGWHVVAPALSSIVLIIEQGAPAGADVIRRFASKGDTMWAIAATEAEVRAGHAASFRLADFLDEVIDRPRNRRSSTGDRILDPIDLPGPEDRPAFRYYACGADRASVPRGGAVVHLGRDMTIRSDEIRAWTATASEGRLGIRCRFTEGGRDKLRSFLRDHAWRTACLVVDDELICSAPIRAARTPGDPMFSLPRADGERVLEVLRMGTLPARPAIRVTERPSGPDLTGAIQRVNGELRFVLVGKGRRDGMARGMRLRIFRPAGRSEGRALGTVHVDFVYPRACSASFFDLTEVPKPGDRFVWP